MNAFRIALRVLRVDRRTRTSALLTAVGVTVATSLVLLLLGLPYAVENIALFRNTDLVPEAPATFEDLETVALQLQSDGTVEVPLAIQQAPTADPYHNYPMYSGGGGYVFGELGRLPKRGDMVRVNGYSLRVEAVRENRVEAVRIRDHHGEEERDQSVPMQPRPVEEAASTPRRREQQP